MTVGDSAEYDPLATQPSAGMQLLDAIPSEQYCCFYCSFVGFFSGGNGGTHSVSVFFSRSLAFVAVVDCGGLLMDLCQGLPQPCC